MDASIHKQTRKDGFKRRRRSETRPSDGSYRTSNRFPDEKSGALWAARDQARASGDGLQGGAAAGASSRGGAGDETPPRAPSENVEVSIPRL